MHRKSYNNPLFREKKYRHLVRHKMKGGGFQARKNLTRSWWTNFSWDTSKIAFEFSESHNKFLLFLYAFIYFFSFFLSYRCSAETLGLPYVLWLSLLSILFFRRQSCNLDKYPLCRRYKCTRQDRKKNEPSTIAIGAKISRNYS